MGNIIKKLLITLIRMLPLRNDIILESHPDFSDNAGAFYQFLLKKNVNKKIKIHWALHDGTEMPVELPEGVDAFYLNSHGIRELWKRMNIMYRSKYILDSNSYIKKRKKGQVRIHLGHGMLIKVTPGYHGAEYLEEVDGYLTTGRAWEKVFTDKLHLPESCLLPIGYPRNDVLCESTAKTERFGNYMMWMPTYRQHHNTEERHLSKTLPYGLPEIESEEELERLNQVFEEQQMVLYYRPHPAQDLSKMNLKNLPAIRLANDTFLQSEGITLYEMIAGAKAMITDYSSVYFDYLLTERPIALTFGDQEEYFTHYDCAFDDLSEAVQGYSIREYSDVLAFVKAVSDGNADADGTIRKMKAYYHDLTDETACERLYHVLQEQYNFGK